MKAVIKALASYLPERVLDNHELARDYPEWNAGRIEEKLGIVTRHIAAPDECASDMGVKAAEKLFASGACLPTDIDFLLFCTQSPDYRMPASACLVQHRLGIPVTAGALDFNLGCSGYVYGLGLAQGLVETGQARRLLLITADTLSRFLHPQDKTVRTLFGDAASATLVSAENLPAPSIGPFVYGTDGAGSPHIIIEAGGMRKPAASQEVSWDEHGNPKSEGHMFMDGPEVFSFTQDMVPRAVATMLARAGLKQDDIDLFVFHQANQYLLDFLRQKTGIPPEKFVLCMKHTGNTGSSTIPIALQHAVAGGALQPGALVMLVGFGVGYSWAAALVRWC